MWASRRPKMLLFVALLAAAGLGCGLTSALPPIEGIPTALPAAEPTAVPALLEDDFSDSDSGWGTGTDSHSGVEYENGVLRMRAFEDYYFTWSNPDQEDYQDVHLEVTVTNESGDTGVIFGLICDQQPEESLFHYFAITSEGEYAIARSQSGAEDLFLTNDDSWGRSAAISEDAPSYRLGADCRGGELAMYVDGQLVDSVSDSTFVDGGVGLFLWSEGDASGTVSFDDFLVSRLK